MVGNGVRAGSSRDLCPGQSKVGPKTCRTELSEVQGTVNPKLQKRWILKDNFCEHGFHISKYNVSSWTCLNRFLNLRRNFENLTFELFSSLHLPVKSWFLLFFENHEVWRDIKHLQLDLVGSSKHQWLPEHLLALLDKNQKNHFTTT